MTSRRLWGERRVARRLFVTYDLEALNLPRIHVGVDGEHGDDEMRYVALNYGNGSSDPVFSIDVDLSGTRAGRWLAEAVWLIRERRRGEDHRL